MHRHSYSRLSKPSKRRSATLLVILVVAVCSLLAVYPVLKARTHPLLAPTKQKAQLQSIPDDSQIARERAIQLGLVSAGKYPISKYDLVSAMPSDQTHLPVVKGSRSWRKVCHTAITACQTSKCKRGKFNTPWHVSVHAEQLQNHYPQTQGAILISYVGNPHSNFHQL